MNDLNSTDRKNVTFLGEEELTKVIGGWGGHWRRHEGRKCQSARRGGGLRQPGAGGNGSRQNGRGGFGGGGDVNIVIINITINSLGRAGEE